MSADQTLGMWRILDANANRLLEGLRVVEEYLRFELDDLHLTQCCKQLRHDALGQLQRLDAHQRLTARDTLRDVGTAASTLQESQRINLADIAAASQKRVEQSLRCLEEYAKPIAPEIAGQFEALRYRSYVLGKAIGSTQQAVLRLAHARLYVLVDGRANAQALEELVQSLVEAQTDMIQLRDKGLADRELLERARVVRRLTQDTSTLFIMNDRPDVARLAQADGVHVGQTELPVREARLILGPGRLVGVSTHSLQQARQAVLEGADYLGCGPVFPSPTKTFAELAGLDLLRQVARFDLRGENQLPLREQQATRRADELGQILADTSVLSPPFEIERDAPADPPDESAVGGCQVIQKRGSLVRSKWMY
jgi:thiamine-phosphate pyrophosphorylase